MRKQIFVLLVLMSFLLFSMPPKTTSAPIKSTDAQVAENAILVSDNKNKTEIDASGKDILISGNENTIHFTGTCRKLVITGKGNDIDMDTVSSIVITGDNNFVSWRSGKDATTKPAVTDHGGYNNVGKRSGNALSKDEN